MTPLHFCNEIHRFPKYEYILPDGHCVLKQQVYQLTNGIISKLSCYCAQKTSLIHTFFALTNTPKLYNNFFSQGLFIVVMADAFSLSSMPISVRDCTITKASSLATIHSTTMVY